MLTLLLLAAISCNNFNNFYGDYQDGDLWRLPLREPYDLKNIAGAKPSEYYNSNWSLALHVLKVDGIANQLNVTMLNVDKGIIYGYGDKYPCYHFIINWNSKEENIYKDTTDWRNQLVKLHILPDKLYNVWVLFDRFKKDSYLEWHH